MIKVISNASGETLLLFRLDNGWTAAALPDREGFAKLVAWPGHRDEPGTVVETGSDHADPIDLAEWIDFISFKEAAHGIG